MGVSNCLFERIIVPDQTVLNLKYNWEPLKAREKKYYYCNYKKDCIFDEGLLNLNCIDVFKLKLCFHYWLLRMTNFINFHSELAEKRLLRCWTAFEAISGDWKDTLLWLLYAWISREFRNFLLSIMIWQFCNIFDNN